MKLAAFATALCCVLALFMVALRGPARGTREQRVELLKGCDVLIGTPGRLLDFMDKPHVLSLHRVKYTIIDEADEMLQSDWEQEFNKIMSGGGYSLSFRPLPTKGYDNGTETFFRHERGC